MCAIVHHIDLPAVQPGMVNQVGKPCIFEPEPGAAGIHAGRDPHDRIHDLVQQATVGYNQVTTRMSR